MVKAWCACMFRGTLARSKSRLQFQVLLLTRPAGAGTAWQKCLLQGGERPVLPSSSGRLVVGESIPSDMNTPLEFPNLILWLPLQLSFSQSFATPPPPPPSSKRELLPWNPAVHGFMQICHVAVNHEMVPGPNRTRNLFSRESTPQSTDHVQVSSF
jgi:hypothetical protein